MLVTEVAHAISHDSWLTWCSGQSGLPASNQVLCKQIQQGYAKERWFPLLPVIVYALFAARYVAYNDFVALQMVAIFTMGLPSLLALTRVFLAPEFEPKRPALL